MFDLQTNVVKQVPTTIYLELITIHITNTYLVQPASRLGGQYYIHIYQNTGL